MYPKFTFKAKINSPVKYIKPISFQLVEGQKNFKYTDVSYAYDNSVACVQKIIEQFPIEGNHKNVLIDIKVHDIEKENFPCLPGWHTDCTLNPWHYTLPEVHHIYMFGAECRTRFLDEDFEMSFESMNPKYIKDKMNSVIHKSWAVQEGYIYRYDRFSLHAPSLAEKTGKRLLIRITESDLIRPNRRIFSNFSSGRYMGSTYSRS